ncbi:hypothetical protein HanXRQr2_Chr02g0049451 [Helianthus annuus]|uniref:Uncharacterized protein n=1 Tax=Helianthus annuus TaxID=4232 RepID=A0A9K3JL74_HELAN|nr:hypothetical protein HanXRQr2_Chr02g0049451 [Helianthus annuus]
MFTKHHERTCNNQKYKANNASLLKKVVFKPKVNWYGVVGFMKKWSWIWIRVFKKALGQFHDYFIECSTKFYYIV